MDNKNEVVDMQEKEDVQISEANSDMEEKKKDNKHTKAKLIASIIIIIIILLLLRSCGNTSTPEVPTTTEKMEVATNIVKRDKDTQAIVNELNLQVLKSMVNVNISKTIRVDSQTGKVKLSISNNGFDGVYMKNNLTTGSFVLSTSLGDRTLDEVFTETVHYESGDEIEEFKFTTVPEQYWKDTLLQCIIVDEDNNILFDSKGIPYGNSMEEAFLETTLPKGTYEATARFYKYYPSTNEKVGPAETPVKIIVE